MPASVSSTWQINYISDPTGAPTPEFFETNGVSQYSQATMDAAMTAMFNVLAADTDPNLQATSLKRTDVSTTVEEVMLIEVSAE